MGPVTEVCLCKYLVVVKMTFGYCQFNDIAHAHKGSSELMNPKTGVPSSKVVYPDTSQMVIYDPRQTNGM